jgi:hypothetical protein
MAERIKLQLRSAALRCFSLARGRQRNWRGHRQYRNAADRSSMPVETNKDLQVAFEDSLLLQAAPVDALHSGGR